MTAFDKEEEHIGKTNSPEEIISKLREADILIGQGKTVALVIKAIGVADII